MRGIQLRDLGPDSLAVRKVKALTFRSPECWARYRLRGSGEANVWSTLDRMLRLSGVLNLDT